MIKFLSEFMAVLTVALFVFLITTSAKGYAVNHFTHPTQSNLNHSHVPTHEYNHGYIDGQINIHDGLAMQTYLFDNFEISQNYFHLIDPLSQPYSSSINNNLGIDEKLLVEKLAVKYRKPKSYIKNIWQRVLTETKKSKVDIDPLLVLAMIEQESSFNNNAKSHANAQGLMQVIPRWHPEKINQGDSLYDVNVSVRVGVKVLEEYMVAENGNLVRALQRYNGALSDPKRRYANRVIAKQRQLERAVSLA